MMQMNIITSTTLIAVTFIYTQMISHTPLTCVITLGSPTLPAPEAGDSVISSTIHVLITMVHTEGGIIGLCRC
jgi:hypothetical protein